MGQKNLGSKKYYTFFGGPRICARERDRGELESQPGKMQTDPNRTFAYGVVLCEVDLENSAVQ